MLLRCPYEYVCNRSCRTVTPLRDSYTLLRCPYVCNSSHRTVTPLRGSDMLLRCPYVCNRSCRTVTPLRDSDMLLSCPYVCNRIRRTVTPLRGSDMLLRCPYVCNRIRRTVTPLRGIYMLLRCPYVLQISRRRYLMCAFFCSSDCSISTRVDMLAPQAEVTLPLWQREETVESQLMTTSQSSDRWLFGTGQQAALSGINIAEPICRPPPPISVSELRVLQILCHNHKQINKLRDLSPRANYTDRVYAWSHIRLYVIECIYTISLKWTMLCLFGAWWAYYLPLLQF
jgi:hypothetical protein